MGGGGEIGHDKPNRPNKPDKPDKPDKPGLTCLSLKKVDSQTTNFMNQLKRIEARLRVLALYEEGYSGYRISKILSVPKSTVNRWIAKFAHGKENNMAAMNAMTGNPEKCASEASALRKQPANETAEQKIGRLEKALREAELRADFYDEMINVAEKKFDIQIRKKAGAKR